MANKESRMIQSVLKAIDLMGVFTPQEPCLPLSEIAARADHARLVACPGLTPVRAVDE